MNDWLRDLPSQPLRLRLSKTLELISDELV
jgi:hypothetical protein